VMLGWGDISNYEQRKYIVGFYLIVELLFE